jgi:hypothetical protein
MIQFTAEGIRLQTHIKVQLFSAKYGKGNTEPITSRIGFDTDSGVWVWYPEKKDDKNKRV